MLAKQGTLLSGIVQASAGKTSEDQLNNATEVLPIWSDCTAICLSCAETDKCTTDHEFKAPRQVWASLHSRTLKYAWAFQEHSAKPMAPWSTYYKACSGQNIKSSTK